MSYPEQTSSGSSMATAKTSNKTTNSNSSYDNKKKHIPKNSTTQATQSLKVV
jgi:hypothetical protein